MEKALQLSGWQLFGMTSAFVAGTTFILLPVGLISSASQLAWLVQLWSVLFGLAVGGFWLYVASRYPGLSLVEISRRALGKHVGGFVSLCYIVFFIQISAWVTRNMSDFMQINLMPKTPLSVFNILALLVCAYAVIKGIDTISLVSVVLIPLLTIAYWTPFTVMLREWNWNHFDYPVNFDFWPTLAETKYALGFPFMETVAFMMAFPLVRTRLKTAFLGGILFMGFQISLSIFFTVGILGVYRSSHLTYPIYNIFREMQFSTFLEHLEAIVSVTALMLVFVKLSVLFYCAVSSICQLFAIENRAIVAYPLVWVISAYALLFANIVDNEEWVQHYLFIYYVPFGIGFPLLFLIASWFRRRSDSTKEATA
ncbi:GerAB/ArcD/ProY family transporter [Paenibacillus sacheonensis]|uniref:Endospore germination permease n=1 Tax=Paenibacillus sacheonensis TaxID=742054 RepID=A0A7X4YQ83_9BACL|nr:endospore germination permease [Paenibacillus sacheonensis]MBM7566347.1 spore germination protein KB [Paenibacillus sacheonensis]NBC70550.1 endospore germination permease [Paenibacillus sacheonensis]